MYRMTRRDLVFFSTALAAGSALATPTWGQSRKETLRYVTGGVVNSLDPVMLGGTPESTAMSAFVYDRLVAFERKPNGPFYIFDFDRIHGELAERYEVSDDRLTYTFHLRSGAVWHDGSPVTATDVKWSLDRAVSAQTMSKAQVATGSLASPDQFTVIDDHTVQIKLAKADRLVLPNLASLYAPMFNSKLASQHAAADDPWATKWLKENTAAGGAYEIESFTAGQQVVLRRNDKWKSGARPAFPRAFVQTVPDATTRANLIERGDADVTINLQAQDMIALDKSGKAKVASIPMPTAFTALIFNTQMKPFDNKLVRQALALALPYDDMFKGAMLGLGGKLYGADWQGEPKTSAFPQPLPFHTDLKLAKQKLAEAGYPDGFETTLSYSVIRAPFADPASSLTQEALGKIRVKVKIEKLPDPQMAQAVTEKRLPMLMERSLALFPSTEYFFRIFLSGTSRWNFSSWNNAEVNELLPQARFEANTEKYDAIAKKLIGLLAEEVPMVTLWQPTQDVAMVPSIGGFTTWYHYSIDIRDFVRV